MVKNKGQRFVPRDDDDETLHKVVKITGETKLKFRVMWEGEDPETGRPWEQSLVPKADCTNDLVDAWNEEKMAKTRKSKQRQPTNEEISPFTSSDCMPQAVVSISTPTSLPKNRKPVAGNSVLRKTVESKAVETLSEGWVANGAKFGPPTRKKQKKQGGSFTTDPVIASTSTTYGRNLTMIPMSPASVKRLADFDREVLGLNPEGNNVQGRVSGFQIENIENAVRMDEKEGKAIKMVDALRSHSSTHSCPQETPELPHADEREQPTNGEVDIGHQGIRSNEVGPLSQKNLWEVGDGGRGSSKSARSEIPSGVGGVAQWSTRTQPGPKLGAPLELSNVGKTFGVSLRGSSDTAVVVLANRSIPADTVTSNILDLRLRASLAANDIISVTRTQRDGFRLVWIKFCSPDHARRFRRAALSCGGAPFFCEQVHQILFDAVSASPGSGSKEWVDPKGSRRKRKRK